MPQEPLVVADVFCGAGGLSAGFKNAVANWPESQGQRFEIAYAIDRDKDAIKTFRAFHFPHIEQERLDIIAPYKDIQNVTPESILDAIKPWKQVDVLIGGPSCQGVSAAGLRNPDDHRNNTLLAFIHLVDSLRPQWFVMENVPGLTHSNNRELLSAIFEKFESIGGYNVRGEMLLAADYGVAQFRYRFFIIGTNTDAPIRFPSATHNLLSSDQSQILPTGISAYRTVRQEIGDLSIYPPKLYDKNASPNQLNLQDLSLPPNHYCIQSGKMNRERIAVLRPGQDWRDMPVHLLPERCFASRASDQKGSYGRLLWDWPSYTITNAAYNVTAGTFTHPEHDRGLSVREAARLQSFSDDHIFYGRVLSQYRQVGNAVPPQLAQAIAETVLYCHYKREEAQHWGTPGSISLTLIRDTIQGKTSFPVMTPRSVHPLFDRRRTKKGQISAASRESSRLPESVWDAELRPLDMHPEDTDQICKLAEQPGNYRATKRAKAIAQFIDGVDKKQIVEEANVSETSVRKWINGYFESGLDGWRAYHTPLARAAGYNSKLLEQIAQATMKARQMNLSSSKDQPVSKRLYMNPYLLELIEHFGNQSVAELITAVEEKLEIGIGTVYVGDLLAICDVVLGQNILTEQAVGEDSVTLMPR